MLKEIINIIYGYPKEENEGEKVPFTKKENAKSVLIFIVATILCYSFDAYYLLFFSIFGAFILFISCYSVNLY